mmetsp:Transcript_12039/g.50664  ORF Transcript_12039/g.50664 Transcript_12039/m.50664 type:complete len:215 (-) Transcript_12039:473-1117(-)
MGVKEAHARQEHARRRESSAGRSAPPLSGTLSRASALVKEAGHRALLEVNDAQVWQERLGERARGVRVRVDAPRPHHPRCEPLAGDHGGKAVRWARDVPRHVRRPGGQMARVDDARLALGELVLYDAPEARQHQSLAGAAAGGRRLHAAALAPEAAAKAAEKGAAELHALRAREEGTAAEVPARGRLFAAHVEQEDVPRHRRRHQHVAPLGVRP